MDFKELLDYCKVQAISSTLASDELSVWRSICRSYSKKFHTPLHLVLEMDPEEVMLSEFEDQLDDFKEEDVENVLEQIYMIEDPNYVAAEREDLKEFMAKAERDEEERLRLGKPIHKELKNEVSIKETLPKKVEPLKEPKPTGGSLNLSYLEKLDSSDRENGFD